MAEKKGEQMFKSILVPVDIADESQSTKSVEVALDLAIKYKATLNIVTVVPDFGVGMVSSFFESDFSDKAIAKANDLLKAFATKTFDGSVEYTTRVYCGTIYDQIISAADSQGCDLIVMGSHRPDFGDYLLGPNAARVMRHADQSVFIVRD